MRDAGVESLEAAAVGSHPQHCSQNQHIGEEDEEKVKSHGGEHYKQPKDTVDPSIGAGELYDVRMQAVGMREYIGATKAQPPQEDGERQLNS